MKDKKQNRRYFIKSAVAGLVVGVVFLWDKMIIKQKMINSRKLVSIQFEPHKEVSFQDDFIVINKGGKTKVLSSKCTHLGCKINEFANNQLLCPCHGSTFDLNGNATKGPAVIPLENMKFEINELKNKITITI